MIVSNAYELREYLNRLSDEELKGALVWASYSEDIESGTVEVGESRAGDTLEEIQIVASADDI